MHTVRSRGGRPTNGAVRVSAGSLLGGGVRQLPESLRAS
jgi:hypothetical protein